MLTCHCGANDCRWGCPLALSVVLMPCRNDSHCDDSSALIVVVLCRDASPLCTVMIRRVAFFDTDTYFSWCTNPGCAAHRERLQHSVGDRIFNLANRYDFSHVALADAAPADFQDANNRVCACATPAMQSLAGGHAENFVEVMEELGNIGAGRDSVLCACTCHAAAVISSPKRCKYAYCQSCALSLPLRESVNYSAAQHSTVLAPHGVLSPAVLLANRRSSSAVFRPVLLWTAAANSRPVSEPSYVQSYYRAISGSEAESLFWPTTLKSTAHQSV